MPGLCFQPSRSVPGAPGDDRIIVWRLPRECPPSPGEGLRGIARALALQFGEGQAPQLGTDDRGRPRCDAPVDASASHAGDCLLVALAGGGRRVGIDVEPLRRFSDPLEIARHQLTSAEADALEALPAADRHLVLLRLWCAREALTKAHGSGLLEPSPHLALGVTDGLPHLLDCDPALGDPRRWTLLQFEPAPGHVAALAWRGRPAQVEARCAWHPDQEPLSKPSANTPSLCS